MLSGKRILITGAASGIGRATALLAAQQGAALLLCDRDESGLIAVQAKCPGSSILAVDLTDEESVKKGLMADVAANGKLSALAHIAGRPYISPLKTVDRQRFDDVLHLNSYAGVQLAQLFTSKRVSDGGSIVFISSAYANVGSAANVGYAMSKGAVQSMTKALAIELAPRNFRVNCVAPGFVVTAMMEQTNAMFDPTNREAELKALAPLGLGYPEDVAQMVCFLLSDATRWVTGAIIPVDGGFTAK